MDFVLTHDAAQSTSDVDLKQMYTVCFHIIIESLRFRSWCKADLKKCQWLASLSIGSQSVQSNLQWLSLSVKKQFRSTSKCGFKENIKNIFSKISTFVYISYMVAALLYYN